MGYVLREWGKKRGNIVEPFVGETARPHYERGKNPMREKENWK